MPGVKWTREQLDDFQKRGGTLDGDAVGKPQQGKPLIEVLFPRQGLVGSTEDEDGLNKTERAFLGWIESNIPNQEIYAQTIRLRLAKSTWYKPDFIVRDTNGDIMVFEVKGFMRDDAAVKIKVAAENYRAFRFYIVRKKRKKEGGGWDIRRVEP